MMKSIFFPGRVIVFLFLILFFMCHSVSGALDIMDSQTGDAIPIIYDYPLPEVATLFEEAVPLTERSVRERLDREFTIIVWDRPQVIMWLKRSGRFFPYIEEQLRQAGMPDDLKYIAVAESSFHSHIRSRAGAVGIWQFMSHTAKKNGLIKKRGIDERRDFFKATTTAIKYLKKLHDTFGSWNLAVAAYNCGEGRLKGEMKKQKITDYYKLKLPNETERYMFRILSIKLIMEDPNKYGYYLAPERIYAPYEIDVVGVNIRIPIEIADVTNELGMSYREIKEINPQLTSRLFPAGKYTINIPEGKKKAFLAAINRSTEKLVKHIKYHPDRYYRVRKGDTLIGISIKTGVSVGTLKRLNDLNGSLIREGQKLLLQP